MTSPHVAVGPPPDWAVASLSPPPITASTGAVLTSFEGWRAPGRDDTLVTGCVATPIPGWVEDMEPSVEGRTVALAATAAGKVVGAPLDARGEGGGSLSLRLAEDVHGPVIGVARTFRGFDDARVFTCFAACVSRSDRGAGRACDDSVSRATLVGSGAPPRPGVLLRAATWSVHHPRPASMFGAGLVLVGGCLAIVLRPRPRHRP